MGQKGPANHNLGQKGPDWASQSDFGPVDQNGQANQLLSQVGSERVTQSEIGHESSWAQSDPT